jgi:hypothetical protein
MKTYARFYTQLERNSLSIYWSEKCSEQELHRRTIQTFHVQYTFPLVLTVLETSNPLKPCGYYMYHLR